MKLAQFLLYQNPNGYFAARYLPNSACRRIYLPGGQIGENETLERLCIKRVKPEKIIYEAHKDDQKIEWWVGDAKMLPNAWRTCKSLFVTQQEIERYDHLHDDAFDEFAYIRSKHG